MSGGDFILTPGSRGEVSRLTAAHTRKGQIANLLRNGVPHTVNAAGWPVVARAWLDQRAAPAQSTPTTGWRSNAPRRHATG